MKDRILHSGLTDEQVALSREKHGVNLLTPPVKTVWWKLFLGYFNDPIIKVLLIAALLSLGISIIHNEYAETIGIFCAIFLATGVAFWFENDANKKFDILNQVNDEEIVMVIRNGQVQKVIKKDIVVGDVVVINMGDEIPADGELLEAVALQMDESSLTGELSMDKTTNPEHFEEGVTYPSNWVLKGTKVINGYGLCIITKVGDATEFGKVAEKATEKVETITPLNRQLDKLAKFIGVVGLSLATLTFVVLFSQDVFFDLTIHLTWGQLGLLAAVILGGIIALSKIWVSIVFDAFELAGKTTKMPKCISEWSWFRWLSIGILVSLALILVGYVFGVDPLNSQSWIDSQVAGSILQHFMVAVTLVVVAVPEGLPMSVTLSLAMSMRRMLNMNNLVRKMHACETMGATTVICTDKTGTLTQNQMQIYETNFYALPNQKLGQNEISKLVVESIAVNSTAYLDFSHPEAHKIGVLGNPTEGALLLWLMDNGINFGDIRNVVERVEQLPFSTEHKYMGTIVKSEVMAQEILHIKGAPEVIVSKSKYVYTDDGIKEITATDKATIEQRLLDYQNQAMRTLAFAYKAVGGSQPLEQAAEGDMILLGFVAISDPVREDVPAAVGQCIDAGISIKIVTGDTLGTAKEIGRQIGIWDDRDDTDRNIITGVDFEALSNEEALERVKDIKIMCRARPGDKQRLVHLLKQQDEIVAVTGDGTNDAPALNYADVGLSMGSGTSVAKEASDITLLDDSFSSIATAVMWGRSLYQNIQRFILFQLTINVAALLLVFLGSVFGHELPLTVTQMLWVNLIMDTFAAGALASLPPNASVMKEKPRNNNAFIVTPGIAKHILITGGLFVVVLLGILYFFSDAIHLNTIFNYIPEADRSRYFLSCFFTIFVMLQFWNLFNAKAYATDKSALKGMKGSGGFVLVALLILVGQVLIVTFGGDVFRTMPLTLRDWVFIVGGTSLVFWIGEAVRWINKRVKG